MDSALCNWLLHQTRPRKAERKKIEKAERTVLYGGNEMNCMQHKVTVKIKIKIN